MESKLSSNFLKNNEHKIIDFCNDSSNHTVSNMSSVLLEDSDIQNNSNISNEKEEDAMDVDEEWS